MQSQLKTELWRLVIVVLWIGLIGAISFTEAPLKFQAPGITIPLGLGIGRLVFFALNMIELALLVATSLLAIRPRGARLTGSRLWVWIALIVVIITKVFIIRAPLNARTDLVLQGADPGQSPWHYVYIACDLITLVLLVICAVQAAKSIMRLAQSRELSPTS